MSLDAHEIEGAGGDHDGGYYQSLQVSADSSSGSNTKPRFGIGYGENLFHRANSGSSVTSVDNIDSQEVSSEGNRERSSSTSQYVLGKLKEAKNWIAREFDSSGHSQNPNRLEAGTETGIIDRFLTAQRDVPLVSAQVLSIDQVDHTIYSTLTVKVPYGVEAGESFTVALPTGENRSVIVPFRCNLDEVTICYKGDEPKVFKEKRNDEKEKDCGDGKLLELYRIHRPKEREALLLRNSSGFGLTVFEGDYGVHVHSAAFTGVESMLQADDILVSVNGKPVAKQKELEDILQSGGLSEIGTAVTLGILRKSPPLTQRCPQGKELVKIALDSDNELLKNDLHCKKCDIDVWNSNSNIGAYACRSCLWTLCDKCFRELNENLMSEKNANNTLWAKDYEEAFGVKLQSNNTDIGKRVRIYWHSTGEWWLGEVTDFNQEHGHTIVYSEGETLSKEVIENISNREYKVLKPKSDTILNV
mmetsp:Transcript_11846/g.13723  ORF Transcript_11846/g.13723 Transcript_11846/m.13723 type:complete len:473 (-) Transcript_11846:2235-3653(-)